MNVIDVASREQFVSLLADNKKVIVDFAARSWCVPCRALRNHFELAASKSDVVFVEVDIEDNPWAQEEYSIMSVPTVKLFEHGEPVRDITARTAIGILKEL